MSFLMKIWIFLPFHIPISLSYQLSFPCRNCLKLTLLFKPCSFIESFLFGLVGCLFRQHFSLPLWNFVARWVRWWDLKGGYSMTFNYIFLPFSKSYLQWIVPKTFCIVLFLPLLVLFAEIQDFSIFIVYPLSYYFTFNSKLSFKDHEIAYSLSYVLCAKNLCSDLPHMLIM